MSIHVMGVSYKEAALELRERVSFTEGAKLEVLEELAAQGVYCVILSTCNRTEIYASDAQGKAEQAVRTALLRRAGDAAERLQPHLYAAADQQAVTHLFEVAAGLESLVLGEDQILGQVQDAYELSFSAGCTDKALRRMFQDAVESARRRETPSVACGDSSLQEGAEEKGTLGDSSLMTTVEENLEIAKMLEAAGADSLHVRLGPLGMHVCQFASDLYFTGYGIDGTTAYGTQFDFSRHWQGKLISEYSGCGMMLDVAREFKDAVSIPVGTVTYMDPAHAPDLFEAALAEGKVDFLLMNRPLTVDPQYANKLKEGRIDEIAPCTRCLHCHFDYDEEGNTYEHCRVNACTQRAFRDDMPEGFDLPPVGTVKNVMVVGGGPAGMEAARIAALRGHNVTLYEKNGAVGGLLDFASTVKGPHENLSDLRSYLARQLEVAGVDVVTGTEVDASFIADQKPDAAIIAVGGVRDTLELSETTGTKVIPLPDFLTAEIGSEVTIVGSNAQAVDAALYLMAQGKHVTMVTPDSMDQFDKGQSNWVKTFVKPMLLARGMRIWPHAEIVSVGDGEVTIAGETGAEITLSCDAVIEAMDMLPNPSLGEETYGIEVHVVGDAAKPWNIAEAIAAGNLAARAL